MGSLLILFKTTIEGITLNTQEDEKKKLYIYKVLYMIKCKEKYSKKNLEILSVRMYVFIFMYYPLFIEFMLEFVF